MRPVQRLKADSLIFALSAVSGSLVARGAPAVVRWRCPGLRGWRVRRARR